MLALLVNPVLKADATRRSVYLPAAAAWYDFWTGKSLTGGQEIEADAPLDRMPLFVRAGSIVPMGAQIEYATQDPAGPIELRIYRGADGDFTLYEDENDTYNYEKGAYSTIPLHWDDAHNTLTIGDRKGQFPGMLTGHAFHVVFVSDKHGVGIDPSQADKVVQYSGQQTMVTP